MSNYRQTVARAFPIRPLGEIVEFLDHKRRPVREADRSPGPFPYYGANGQQGTIDAFLFDEPLILLAEDGGFFDAPERGIAYRIAGKSWVNNHAHVLRPLECVDIGFLARVLENYDVNPFISGSTRSKLTKGQAERIEIPLPPLSVQKHLAAVLDQADEVRQKRLAAIQNLVDLPQSIFWDMFGSKDHSWPVVRLEEAVQTGTIVTYGIVQAGEEFPAGVPYIRTGDLVDGEIELGELRHTDPAIASKFERSRVRSGEIVMSIRATVGTTALVPCALDGANLTQGTARIAPGDRTNPTYLLNYLRAAKTQQWIQKQVKGATFREITLARLRDLPVQLPPLLMQNAYAERIAVSTEMLQKARAHKAELDTLFSVLQHNAFAGKLIAQSALKEASEQ